MMVPVNCTAERRNGPRRCEAFSSSCIVHRAFHCSQMWRHQMKVPLASTVKGREEVKGCADTRVSPAGCHASSPCTCTGPAITSEIAHALDAVLTCCVIAVTFSGRRVRSRRWPPVCTWYLVLAAFVVGFRRGRSSNCAVEGFPLCAPACGSPPLCVSSSCVLHVRGRRLRCFCRTSCVVLIQPELHPSQLIFRYCARRKLFSRSVAAAKGGFARGVVFDIECELLGKTECQSDSTLPAVRLHALHGSDTNQ